MTTRIGGGYETGGLDTVLSIGYFDHKLEATKSNRLQP